MAALKSKVRVMSSRSHLATLTLATAASAALLAGCGGASVPQVSGASASANVAGSSTSTDPNTAAATAGPSDDQIEAFFQAISDYDVDGIKKDIAMTAPGSVAQAYATYEYYSVMAANQGGSPFDAGTFLPSRGTYKSCDDTGGDNSCVSWADVQAQGNKIASFTVSGKPLKSRIVLGGKKNHRVGSLGKVQLVAAYQSVQSKYLFAVVKVTSGSQKVMVDSETAYLTPDGQQVTMAQHTGPNDILPGASGYHTLAFSNSSVGGKIVFELREDGGDYRAATATVPTR